MKRRQFIRYGAAPLLMHGLSLRTFASPAMMQFFGCEGLNDRTLILIQLSGGNDGINTTVPLNQYDKYATLRPDIKLAQTSLLSVQNSLPDNQKLGLHPAMTAMKSLYDQGKVNIVQGVSYAEPNLSHFKSTDLWLTGGDSTPALFNLTSGWMGRYLDSAFPGRIGLPTTQNPDPLGIQIGDDRPSVGYLTTTDISAAVNLGWNNPAGYYNQVLEIGGTPPTSFPSGDYGTELAYIVQVQNNVSAYASRISQVYNLGTNTPSVNYPDTGLAYQLKSVARMISGGSKTKIFLVNTYGFDTHSNQVEAGNTSLGAHASLLTELSVAVKAFIDDLTAQNKDQNVLACTFSEFGRKPGQNANFGTDHGTIAPMFIIGSPVQAGVTGLNPNFNNIQDELFTEVNIDYRRIYTTLLQDWLGAGQNILDATLFGDFANQKLNLIKTTSKADPSCYGAIALPVRLIHFEANLVNTKWVECNWTVAAETPGVRYEVQRSHDGRHFQSILIQEGLGDIAAPAQYSDYDKSPWQGISYYRLRLIDPKGEGSYSDQIKIIFKTKFEKSFKIYPNPAIFDVNIVLNNKENSTSIVEIINLEGKIIYNSKWDLKEGFNKTNINIEQYPIGAYQVRISDTLQKIYETAPLIIQR